ncbi:BamA/TamA family outer membrane protein [Reichenbachiella agarivorans]|uniref:BamA/TamA family outer membrane protein n=1 Tax=Reichenbachiella agarivorans TaxID=2979464 RepID=A0ABY6CQR6_9BACT|nr:BamA/TamA family outer membrane protein [Reichenbachiella agarivorans]UXP30645.1 BamA/TamA family outer membrane protein [Reichenbachiella agarivorans]
MGRRYLKGDQKLLVDQKLQGAQKLDKEAIQNLYANKPNEKILFLTWSPYVDLYQLGKKSYDTSKYEQKKRKLNLKYSPKIQKAVAANKTKKEKKLREKLGKKIDKQNINIKEGNLGMRLGEPLAIYDTAKENETVRKIKQYLHSKGYFNAEVSYEDEETFKLVTSTYTIDRKQPYVIDSIFYVIQDSVISKILFNQIDESLIIKGDNYEQENLTKERDRINLLMLDNGYYNFLRSYVHFKVDSSSLGDKKVAIGVQIENPTGLDAHKIFRIDSVIFTTDSDVNNITQPRSFNEYKDVTYRFHHRRYHEKILDWRLFLYPDSVYSRSNTLETQKQLSNMDIFKFINVNYDTTGGKFIANVFTSRLKKYQTSTETGLSVSQGLPGPFFNASIKNRNTFKGLEITELSGRIGFEGLTGATETDKPYSSLDYGANLSFTFPQFIIPAGDKIKSKLGRYNPKTRVAFGLNYNSRLEYLRNNINATWSYTWQNYEKRISHILNLSEINYINSDITDDYRDFLEDLEAQGNNLIRSFSPSFVSSTSYTATHNINEYGNKKSTSSYLRYKIETGGNFIKSVGRTAFNDSDSIQYFKFAKFNVDFRRTTPLNSVITIAYRINTGLAVPYGDNKTLPYEKFYFAGGSNSIRAWEPRRLGPGSFLPVNAETGKYNNSFEQPGEILLEASMEFRHRLFGPIHGAMFVDAGNVWTLYDDPSRPGSQFEVNDFYKEIAIGAGYGLRVDFSFLILRLDAAWKLSEPGQTSQTDSYEHNTFEIPDYLPDYKRLVWNLGIGYPF